MFDTGSTAPVELPPLENYGNAGRSRQQSQVSFCLFRPVRMCMNSRYCDSLSNVKQTLLDFFEGGANKFRVILQLNLITRHEHGEDGNPFGLKEPAV